MKAFPLTNTNTQHTGMDLRDYFAAAAMITFIEDELKNPDNFMYSRIAESSYMLADIMLEIRQR